MKGEFEFKKKNHNFSSTYLKISKILLCKTVLNKEYEKLC